MLHNDKETDFLIYNAANTGATTNTIKYFASSASWFFPLHHYLIMCFTFSVPFGCMMVAYDYAGAAFGLTQSSFSSGLSCLIAVITTLVLAMPMINKFGAANTLVTSMFCYLINLFFFALAAKFDMSENMAWAFVMIGGIGAGVAVGVGWVAQGVYFSIAAQCYAEEKDMPKEEANNEFASYFATIMLGTMGFLYLVSSLLLEFSAIGVAGLYWIMTGSICLNLIIALLFLQTLPKDENQIDRATGLKQLMAVLMFPFVDKRAMALTPMALAFGFGNAFSSLYMNEGVAAKYIGSYSVGYLNAIYTAAIMLISIPCSTLLNKFQVLSLGVVGYILLAAAFLAFSNSELGQWGYAIPIYLFYAVGRMSWENASKAIFADLFVHNRASAFAYFYSVSVGLPGLYSFALSYLEGGVLALFFLIPALLIIPGYFMTLNMTELPPPRFDLKK